MSTRAARTVAYVSCSPCKLHGMSRKMLVRCTAASQPHTVVKSIFSASTFKNINQEKNAVQQGSRRREKEGGLEVASHGGSEFTVGSQIDGPLPPTCSHKCHFETYVPATQSHMGRRNACKWHSLIPIFKAHVQQHRNVSDIGQIFGRLACIRGGNTNTFCSGGK